MYFADQTTVRLKADDGSISTFCTAATPQAALMIAEAMAMRAQAPIGYVHASELSGMERYGRKNVVLWDAPGTDGCDVVLYGLPAAAPMAIRSAA